MSAKCSLKAGLFSIGLAAYWPPFTGRWERLAGYDQLVGQRLGAMG